MLRLSFENPWVVGVDRAARPANGWLVLGLGVAVCAAAVILGRWLGAQLSAAIFARIEGPWAAILSQAGFYLCVFLPLWLAAVAGGVIEGRVVWRRGAHALVALPVGLALGALGFSACVALALGAGVIAVSDPSHVGLAGGLVGVLIVALQAGGEEIFFRGWMQPVLCARFGPWIGLLVTSTVFMGLHLVGGVRSPISGLNLLLGGLLFGLIALRSGGLWGAFGAHWAWNWMESGVFGLDPNPGVVSTGSLSNLDLTGAAIWSGGEDGMNGSLAATVVLLILVAAVAAGVRRPA